MGGLLGGGFGGGSDYDSEGSEEGGMYGFSSDDVFELACQVLLRGAHQALSSALKGF